MLKSPLVGILALQGAVEKHITMLSKINVPCQKVKYAEELEKVDALIIPGGESTTIGKLLSRFSLFDPLEKLISRGLPVFGTCAGLILLAKRIEGFQQTSLKLLDITVTRNAYGPQVESFEADIDIPKLGEKAFRAVFIRAPIITRAAPTVKVLARFEGNPVLVRQGTILASSFHPELTDDERVHRYFAFTLVASRLRELAYKKN
jgi:5'-phosphate synthase pdxT subunit